LIFVKKKRLICKVLLKPSKAYRDFKTQFRKLFFLLGLFLQVVYSVATWKKYSTVFFSFFLEHLGKALRAVCFNGKKYSVTRESKKIF
jgi:hypothetical protein